jgi:hypothetical protein
MARFIQIVRIASIPLCTAYLEERAFTTLPDHKSRTKQRSQPQAIPIRRRVIQPPAFGPSRILWTFDSGIIIVFPAPVTSLFANLFGVPRDTFAQHRSSPLRVPHSWRSCKGGSSMRRSVRARPWSYRLLYPRPLRRRIGRVSFVSCFQQSSATQQRLLGVGAFSPDKKAPARSAYLSRRLLP